MIRNITFMSDREIIIQLLRSVEWRIRANRLCYELTLAFSIVLAALIFFKIWDLFFPLSGVTIGLVAAALLVLFVAFAGWRIGKKGTLEQAATLIDRKVGLRDELKTAFWFLNNPLPSAWVEEQIRRAAQNARDIDVRRVYPTMIPKTSYVAVGTVLVFGALNFISTPFNHNWLMLQAAPSDSMLGKTAGDGPLDRQAILKSLQEVAERLRESQLLKETADDLTNGDVEGAANDLRSLAEQIGNASSEEIAEFRAAMAAAAATKQDKADLEPALQEMADTSETAEDTGIYEEMMQTAEALQELAEKLQTAAQDGESYQTGKATDQAPSKETVQVSDAAPGNLKQSNSVGPGGGSDAPPGGLAELPTSLEAKLRLDVKLEAQAVQGFEANKVQPKDEDEEEISQATKRERSKVNYRNVKSDLSPAQKDLLNQDHVPWEYRALIKGYFQAIRPAGPAEAVPAKK
jgi:hypothetical protein